MPRGKFGGTTAVRRGGLADPKADKAAGRCSSSFSGVYKGTQPSVALNSSGGQSASRPFSSRYGIQWSVTMSGTSLSTAAERRANRGEALVWASVGVTSGSNPRSQACTSWTGGWSLLYNSFLVAMRTASVVLAGGLCSCGGAVSSPSAGFFVGGASDGSPA